MSCTNNQKQLGIASHACHDTIGKFPYGINRNDGAFPRDDLTLSTPGGRLPERQALLYPVRLFHPRPGVGLFMALTW